MFHGHQLAGVGVGGLEDLAELSRADLFLEVVFVDGLIHVNLLIL